MKKIFLVASLLFTFLFFYTVSSTNVKKDYIQEIENYLNEMTTFEADFVQFDKYNRASMGSLLLKRPYLMKMDYLDPPTHVIIARDNKIIHYDRELKEKTVTSAYSSPLSFFLDRKINIRDNFKVISSCEEQDMLSVKFCKNNEDIEGAITLVFSKNPLTLRQWIIFDNKKEEDTNKGTSVSLLNWKSGHAIPDSAFEKFNAGI